MTVTHLIITLLISAGGGLYAINHGLRFNVEQDARGVTVVVASILAFCGLLYGQHRVSMSDAHVTFTVLMHAATVVASYLLGSLLCSGRPAHSARRITDFDWDSPPLRG